MFFTKNTAKFIIFLLLINLSSCGALPSKPALEPDGKERARKNVREGKGVNFGFGKSNKGGDFLFASSNPMWRASLEIIDFMPLSNVDYAGGLIITDWYSDKNPNEAIKFTIKFLSNEIRADGIIIDIHKKSCLDNSNGNCIVKKIESELSIEIKDKILKKAVIYEKELTDKNIKRQPAKVFGGDNE